RVALVHAGDVETRALHQRIARAEDDGLGLVRRGTSALTVALMRSAAARSRESRVRRLRPRFVGLSAGEAGLSGRGHDLRVFFGDLQQAQGGARGDATAFFP